MNAPTSAPANWRDLYGFSGNGMQKNLTQQDHDYWNLNVGNGSREAIATNSMPYVMDPASVLANGQVPDARASNKANMYSAQQPAGGAQGGKMGGMPQVGADPMAQILGLLQSNPEVLPLLLQQLLTQGQAPA